MGEGELLDRAMPRTILVGDVHGCLDELDALLAYVGFGPCDRLVMVGDLVARGPDSHGVVKRLRDLGARAVRGNHEDRLLRWRAGSGPPLGAAHREASRSLTKRDWAWLAELPFWIDLPDHGIRVVHAGVLPGVPLNEQDPRVLMNIRSVGRMGEAIEERGRAPWGALYGGPLHIVFGHNAQDDVQIHPHATGLDTGAVYGGRLTAMVLFPHEHPPPPAQRRQVLVSLPSRRAYFPR